MLGIGERTARRWRDRRRDEGPVGWRDRRIGKPSGRRTATGEIVRMLGLYEQCYGDFTVKHFHEQPAKRHGYKVTRLALPEAGLVRPAAKRSAHRKKRARRALAGMMLHQDGSRHDWLRGHPALDLIVTLDDATSAIYSAFLVEEAGSQSSFRGIAEAIARQGLFCELYTNRGIHYFYSPKAGEAVSKTVRTQVGRTLAQPGIRHIAAYSPEARSRSERAFRTLREGRRVGNDNTVKWRGLLADSTKPAAAACRARHGAAARIPRRPARGLSRSASLG